jgi:hypothetical protein
MVVVLGSPLTQEVAELDFTVATITICTIDIFGIRISDRKVRSLMAGLKLLIL